MRFAVLTFAAAVPAFVSAAQQMIAVGSNGTLTFSPPSINASLGDSVSFVFQSKNHSVVQSTFANPCNQSSSGFNSQFNFAVNGSSAGFPSFTINVTQTAPIWFFCGQTTPQSHCHAGMVGVINPTADKTFAMFQAAATNSSATNGSSSALPSSTGAASAPGATQTGKNGAMRVSGGAAGLLTLLSVAVGVIL